MINQALLEQISTRLSDLAAKVQSATPQEEARTVELTFGDICRSYPERKLNSLGKWGNGKYLYEFSVDSDQAAQHLYKLYSEARQKKPSGCAYARLHSPSSCLYVGSLCDRYQGDYNPHYLTGLGSALWVVDQYRHQPAIAVNALFQYLDFFFSGLKS